MNLIIYLIAGAIVGYIASRIMRTNSQQGLLLDIVVGVIGAFLAGYFISPMVGIGTINDAITIPTLVVTLIGSIALLAIVNIFRGRRFRSA
ncbi:MAG: GlsB/YeaQ/YmgE family stress response membrane protein [Chloroflexi bacterium]|nr:GlsB/YeaQ/YmgE family stress response membrane protein [Chloroflexota bacterium]